MKRRRRRRTVDLIVGATSTLRARIRAKTIRGKRRECWRWTGAVSLKRGGARRPVIQVGCRGSRMIVVSRILLVLKDGVPLAKRRGLEAGHTCHNHWCVNPNHLEWQTRIENENAKHEYDAYQDFADAVDELALEELESKNVERGTRESDLLKV